MKYEYLSVDGLTEFTPEHDAVLLVNLTPVLGISPFMKKTVSVKVPNAITSPTYISGYDYDNHPMHNTGKIRTALAKIGVEKSCYIDCPRYGDTLRYFFDDTETAQNFINELLN